MRKMGTSSRVLPSDRRKLCFPWLKRLGNFVNSNLIWLFSSPAHTEELLPMKTMMTLPESRLNESKNERFVLKLWSQFQVFGSLLFLIFLSLSGISGWLTARRWTSYQALTTWPASTWGTALGFILPWFLLAFLPQEDNATFSNSVWTCHWGYFLLM